MKRELLHVGPHVVHGLLSRKSPQEDATSKAALASPFDVEAVISGAFIRSFSCGGNVITGLSVV